jgi:hypothetical protein
MRRFFNALLMKHPTGGYLMNVVELKNVTKRFDSLLRLRTSHST